MNTETAQLILARWQSQAEYFPKRFRRLSRVVFDHPHLFMFRVLLSCGHLVTVPRDFYFRRDGKPNGVQRCPKCFDKMNPVVTVCDFCRQLHAKQVSCSRPPAE